MKKAVKNQIEKTAGKYAAKFGGTFRFRKTNDPLASHYGYFDPNTLEVVVKRTNELFDTICHELAHLEQYVKDGYTDCDNWSDEAAEHGRRQNLIADMFMATGFNNLINSAM